MSALHSDVRDWRRKAGREQGDPAAGVGVRRQTLSAIGAGESVPSTALALALARALDCRVEDLFSVAEPAAIGPISVAPALGRPLPPLAAGGRLRLGLVGGTWVAHRLEGDAPSTAGPPADALAARLRRGRPAPAPP